MALESSSALLRTWRERVLGISQAELARMLAGEGSSTKGSIRNLNRYESSTLGTTRKLNRNYLHDVDDCIDAGGALVDLAWAIGSRSGFAASQSWAHNFQPPHGSVWVWIR